jgi:hypothetical protein
MILKKPSLTRWFFCLFLLFRVRSLRLDFCDSDMRRAGVLFLDIRRDIASFLGDASLLDGQLAHYIHYSNPQLRAIDRYFVNGIVGEFVAMTVCSVGLYVTGAPRALIFIGPRLSFFFHNFLHFLLFHILSFLVFSVCIVFGSQRMLH